MPTLTSTSFSFQETSLKTTPAFSSLMRSSRVVCLSNLLNYTSQKPFTIAVTHQTWTLCLKKSKRLFKCTINLQRSMKVSNNRFHFLPEYLNHFRSNNEIDKRHHFGKKNKVQQGCSSRYCCLSNWCRRTRCYHYFGQVFLKN